MLKTFGSPVDIVGFIDKNSDLVVVILIIIILTIEVFLLSFPKEIVMIYAGVKFGTIFGGIINLIGLVGAFWLGFESGRSGRITYEERKQTVLLQKYKYWLDRNGLKSLLILRIFPFTPNDILSVSSGFSKLSRSPYLVISFFTAIPYAFFISYIGSEQLDTFLELFPQVFDVTTWAVSFVIAIIVLVYIAYKGSKTTPPSELTHS